MYKVSRRKVTKAEAELLVSQIKLTPNIMGYSLREWLKAENIMVAEDEDGKLVGACLNYDFQEDWQKIAALIVFEEFRGRGIGKLLFEESCKDAVSRKKNIYTISANEIVIKMMRDWDFMMFDSLWEMPEIINQYKLRFYLHSFVWLMNFYRIREIIRKLMVYEYNPSFVFGIRYIPR
ncbi:GNAT family N-acetyltransferase [Nostoc sp. TCL26-01]|nr:GNAT family N-acetyltransferase [Nostoc sp. TCL26-01]